VLCVLNDKLETSPHLNVQDSADEKAAAMAGSNVKQLITSSTKWTRTLTKSIGLSAKA